jgi:hypothetical protein
VIEKGFVCASAIESDPCFSDLSSSPGYDELLALARTRRREAHQIFLDAGGPELLNVSPGDDARA